MSKQLTEKKVLKRLGIKDFRHITKDKVIEMASMLDRMDPEVAKRALEQFPEFSQTMKAVFADFRQSLDKAIESNEKSVSSFYDTCDRVIDECSTMLQNNNLSFEQKKEILDKMILILKMKDEKDSQNKSFIAYLVATGVAGVGIVATALSVALGGDGKLNLDGLKKIGAGI